MSNNEQKKLDGQRKARKAIREHIEKFKKYPKKYDKEFALKTIRNAQKQIKDIRAKNPTLTASSEDTWNPPSNWEKDAL